MGGSSTGLLEPIPTLLRRDLLPLAHWFDDLGPDLWMGQGIQKVTSFSRQSSRGLWSC